MKKNYTAPEMEVLEMEMRDVITTSNVQEDGDID